MPLPSVLLALATAAALPPDSAPAPPAGPRARPAAVFARADTAPADTVRPRAIDVGGGYELRMAVHRWGSYAILPLFAVQTVFGEQIFRQKEDVRAGERAAIDGGLRTRHRVAAIGVGAVFVANTVTGVWNLYDTRGVEDGRTLRMAHSLTMLAADAGFVASGIMGAEGRKHRNVAYGSMALSALSAVGMWALNRD